MITTIQPANALEINNLKVAFIVGIPKDLKFFPIKDYFEKNLLGGRAICFV